MVFWARERVAKTKKRRAMISFIVGLLEWP